MTRLFLAAGVAAMAIAAPLAAKPGGGHGNGGGHGGQPAAQQGGGGGGHGHGGGGGQPAFNGGGGGHGHGGGGPPRAMSFGGGGGGHGHGGGAPRAMSFGGGGHGHGGGFAAPQRHAQRQQGHGNGHQQARNFQRQQAHGNGHQQARNVVHQQGHGNAHQQARNVMRQQAHGNGHQQARNVERQKLRGFERQQARNFDKQQMRANKMQQAQQQAFANQLNGRQFERFNGNNGGKFANRQMAQGFAAAPYQTLTYGNDVQIVPVTQVERFVGVPAAQVATFADFSPLPPALQYFYPSTDDYYYRYGDGYLYQVDRSSSLIAALIPLLFGGYMPGQYLPATYMSSYVPSYYGFNSFYPDYGDVCNRYYSGVIYQVDCASGYVEGVIPMYAGGYGVGQILPSAYNYYNVPMQYRNVYYDTPDYGYWYAPGAIYQYDPRSSVITSVAALMSPGFSIGQPLPIGYDVYNVPMAYRATYYDTPSAWYRYNNGYIYQVDPVTQVVTAIVASLLT